jgi:hypothetical protein
MNKNRCQTVGCGDLARWCTDCVDLQADKLRTEDSKEFQAAFKAMADERDNAIAQREEHRCATIALLQKLPVCSCGNAAIGMLPDGSDVCKNCCTEDDEAAFEMTYPWHRELDILLKRAQERTDA